MLSYFSVTVTPEQILRAYFLLGASVILVLNGIPALRNRFLDYGARKSVPQSSRRSAMGDSANTFIGWLASIQVPHSWFTSFYVFLFLLLAFWAFEFVSRGYAFFWIVRETAVKAEDENTITGMALERVMLTWTLMSIQGARRLYECLAFTKPSQAKMWVGHWIFGMSFYAAMSIAVWVEGIPALRTATPSTISLALTMSSMRVLLFLPLFIVTSGVQHDCHRYLFSLPKYSLPVHPNFKSLICPHYTAECTIYFSLSVLAAPRGGVFNKTILTALALVLFNLGVTAESTRKFYEKKFGAESIKGRWRMIPLLY
ncbi:MAG: hypothetical protein M1816_003490 [Peltula sp. TS41687]|nr:MAG: hypothetical protein M1816_003490 [Peltula sp. TS41687]